MERASQQINFFCFNIYPTIARGEKFLLILTVKKMLMVRKERSEERKERQGPAVADEKLKTVLHR